jgi:Flp pilus assembly protein TadG
MSRLPRFRLRSDRPVAIAGKFAPVCVPSEISPPAITEGGHGAVGITVSAPRRPATSGTVALEFALVGSAFLGLLMFVFELGFLLYAQTALDFGVKEAARQMQTGQQTLANGASQALFLSQVLCPALGALLSCSGVVVSLQPVSTFQTATNPPPLSTATINPGVTGGLMLLQAYYTPAIPIWPLNVTLLVGTAAYLNE